MKVSSNVDGRENNWHGCNAVQIFKCYYPFIYIRVSSERAHVPGIFGLQYESFVDVDRTTFVGYGGGQDAASEAVANTALTELR